jgi:hypothetical protein
MFLILFWSHFKFHISQTPKRKKQVLWNPTFTFLRTDQNQFYIVASEKLITNHNRKKCGYRISLISWVLGLKCHTLSTRWKITKHSPHMHFITKTTLCIIDNNHLLLMLSSGYMYVHSVRSQSLTYMQFHNHRGGKALFLDYVFLFLCIVWSLAFLWRALTILK